MRIAYLSYNSLAAPLVQSQVLPYLRQLVKQGHEFLLLTFERSNKKRSQGVNIASGIDWMPINQSEFGPFVVLSMRRAMQTVLRMHASSPFDLIHARSYLPAMVARRCAERLGVPWIFDMRGFWVDEKVMKGSLRKGGVVYRWLKREELKLLRGSAAIVSLTHRAIPRIEEWIIPETLPPIVVIPTCADLQRFKPLPGNRAHIQKLIFGYVGSLGSGYEGGTVRAFLSSALDRHPSAEVLIVTQSKPVPIQDLELKFPGRIFVRSADYSDMPNLVASMSVGLSFVTPDPSKDASCPTKLGEYLACGIPVVSNRGIGDTEELISLHKVGVLCSDEREFDLAFAELDEMMAKPEKLRNRCRQCAKSVFSVEHGVRKYDALYREIVSQVSKAT